MFSPINDIHANCAVIDRFKQLEEENRNPKMAIFFGRRLVLIATNPQGILETIGQLFKTMLVKFLELVGLLDRDSGKIQVLRDQVKDYHFEQAKLEKEAEFEELDDDLKKQQKDLQGEYDKLKDQKNQLDQDVLQKQQNLNDLNQQQQQQKQANQALEDDRKRLQGDWDDLKGRYGQAQKTVQQAQQAAQQQQDAEKAIQQLENKKDDLTREIGRLVPLQNQVQAAQRQLAAIQADIQQQDYKTKYAAKEQECQNLQAKNRKSTQTCKNTKYTYDRLIYDLSNHPLGKLALAQLGYHV